MPTLTLVAEGLARPAYKFRFLGPNAGPECQGCPFQRLCFGLRPGGAYEVSSVRDVVHPCGLHEGGRVRVALVEEIPFSSTLETRLLRGTAAPWVPIPCGRPDCSKWAVCHPVGREAGARHEVVARGESVSCPAGYELTQVLLRKMA
ncbi:MAG: UPF0179 family protein [Thermoplasmatota archaeon]